MSTSGNNIFFSFKLMCGSILLAHWPILSETYIVESCYLKVEICKLYFEIEDVEIQAVYRKLSIIMSQFNFDMSRCYLAEEYSLQAVIVSLKHAGETNSI